MKESGKKPSVKKVALTDDDTEKKTSAVQQKGKYIPEESDTDTTEEPEEAAPEENAEADPQKRSEEPVTSCFMAISAKGATSQRHLYHQKRRVRRDFINPCAAPQSDLDSRL